MDNRRAYGLAKAKGIDTTGMSPKEVWEALREKGVTKQTYSSDGFGGTHDPSDLEKENMVQRGIPVEQDDSDEDNTNEKPQIDEGLVKFAKDAIEGKIKPTDYYVVGEISARQRADIERLTGNTLSAKSNAIIAQRIVQHIDNNHGKNGRSDRSMMELKNYGLMKYVLDKYDNVEVAMKRGVPDLSAEYTDSKGKPAKQIKFSKKIDKNYIVVLAITDTKKGILKVTSMYVTK